MRYIGTITLLVLCLTLLLSTGCMINTVTPEISMGNSNNPSSNNPNSNNYQNPSTDPVEEPATNPNSNNYQNTSTDPVVEPATVEVDTTKPVITGSRAPLPNSFGWNNTDVTVSFSCADTGPVQSGIKKNTVAGKTLTTEGKNQSVTNTGVCIDAAGNTADPVTVSNINIDKTPPVVTITLPGTGKYVLKQSIKATWSATDALSGVVSPVSRTVSIDTSSVGTKTFTLPAGTAMDKAGNSSLKVTKSYSVIADTEDPETPDTEITGAVYPQTWATGDGTAENPWANNCIQKAYDFVPTGGTIFLRTGYYLLSTALDITKQVNIIGEGMNKTIVVTADDVGFDIHSDYVTLKGFTIDGAAQTEGGSPTYYCNITIHDSDYALVEDLEVKNSGDCGMNLYEVNHSSFQNIYAHDNWEHGVHANAEIAERNMNNTYRNIYAWDNGENGFDDWGCEADPELQRNGVYDNIQAWGNTLNGIILGRMSGASLINSSAYNNDNYGIAFIYNNDCRIENCSVYSNSIADQGINVYDSDNISLTNVIIKNNYSGIAITDCSNIALTSCQSYDDRETPLQQFGMELYTSTGISLLNCKLSPNQYGEIYNPAGVVVTVITEKMLAKF